MPSLSVLKSKIANNELYWKTKGEKGKIANLSGADLGWTILTGKNFSGANLKGANLSGALLTNANFQEADLREVDFCGAVLVGTSFHGANFGKELPSRETLLAALIEHSQSDYYNQSKWCGTSCCLSGRAGAFVGNQSAGAVVIKIVLPEFDLNVLYQDNRDVAIAELNRVKELQNV